MNSPGNLKTMILAVAALLCLTLFQNCDHTSAKVVQETSQLHGHVVVAKVLKSAQHSIK